MSGLDEAMKELDRCLEAELDGGAPRQVETSAPRTVLDGADHEAWVEFQASSRQLLEAQQQAQAMVGAAQERYRASLVGLSSIATRTRPPGV